MGPGEKYYIECVITLTNGSIRNVPMQNMLKRMESQAFVLEDGTTIYYSQESTDKKYLGTFAYKFDNNNIQLIKIETR